MRIMRRKEFLEQPPGIIYSKGREWHFYGLRIKDETVSTNNDWYEIDPHWVDGKDGEECINKLEDMLNNGSSYPMSNSTCKDGMFYEEDIFLVFEKDDLIKLREYIDVAINLYKDKE